MFDRGWADAYERAGGRYYPKLQASVPFTPATGPRLLIRDGVDREADRQRARAGARRALRRAPRPRRCTSPSRAKPNGRFLAEHGFLQRTDQQFHWHNQGYASFDDFLAHAQFAPSQGDQARAPRGAGQPASPSTALTGSDITEDAWDAFFAFYMETGSRKWGRPYLTRAFFSLIGETMAKDVLLVMAKRNGRWIAGAINFIGSDTLFGRNWGAIEHHPFLHFEVCYYQAIDFAIQRGLKTRRGRRAGRAQDRARLSAADHLFRALHRRSRPAPRHRRLSQARARLCRRGRRANSPKPARSARPPTSRLDVRAEAP